MAVSMETSQMELRGKSSARDHKFCLNISLTDRWKCQPEGIRPVLHFPFRNLQTWRSFQWTPLVKWKSSLESTATQTEARPQLHRRVADQLQQVCELLDEREALKRFIARAHRSLVSSVVAPRFRRLGGWVRPVSFLGFRGREYI